MRENDGRRILTRDGDRALHKGVWVRWYLMVALRRDIRIGPVHSRFQVFDPLSLRF